MTFYCAFFLSCQSESICYPFLNYFGSKDRASYGAEGPGKVTIYLKEKQRSCNFEDHLRSTLNNFQMYDKILLILVTQQSEN